MARGGVADLLEQLVFLLIVGVHARAGLGGSFLFEPVCSEPTSSGCAGASCVAACAMSMNSAEILGARDLRRWLQTPGFELLRASCD